MIPFNSKELHVKHVWLKSCTTALGGSISVLDEKRSTDEKEVFTKIKMPMAVVRHFYNENDKRARFLKPVLTAVVFYGDQAVALERHPYSSVGVESETLTGNHWVSNVESHLDKYMIPMTQNNDWYVDGLFVYTFNEKDLNQAESISADGKFKALSCRAFKFGNLKDAKKISAPEDRTCVMYRASCGKTAISPPIWKNLHGVGETKLGLSEDEESGNLSTDVMGIIDGRHQFDRIDELLAVNLAFALKAGKQVADAFGYDAIEPLGLDDMMVQLKTVNLPNVAKEVKETFDIGLPFTHAIAWLLGLTSRTETLESYMTLRALLKYLTTKGIYRKHCFTPDAVYRPDMSNDNVPLLTPKEALTIREKLKKIGATLIGSKGVQVDV